MHPLVKNSEQNGLLNYIRILLSISIVLSIFNPVIIASAASADAVSIGSDRVDPGDVANVAILINNSNNVSGMNLTLEYDPGTIELANIFENYSSTTGHVVSYIDNSGTVDIEVRQIDNLTDAGSVPVLDLVFNALSSGTSDLGLLNVELIENGVPSSPDVTTVGSITVNTAPEFGIIADQYVNESELLSFKLNATDIDNDDLTFDKDVIFGNIAGDVFSWTPTSSDIGVHYINFSVTDSELQDYTVVTITVNEASSVTYTPASPVNFINTTGNFWVLHEWEAGNSGNITDGYNVSYDNSWYNTTGLEFNDTVGMNAHDWSNITVYAYNATSST
ncbi:cohesin domain-containing protein, partial [Methanolobus profundi]